MEIYEAIEGRRSVRKFDPNREISQELIAKILRAACQAPSAGNIQPWRFWAIRDEKKRQELADVAFGQTFIAQAPVVIVVCADLRTSARHYGERGGTLYAIQDTAAAIQNLLLTAFAEGLGACWVGAFSEKSACECLRLPVFLRPIAIIPVGYPAHTVKAPLKKDFSEVTRFI